MPSKARSQIISLETTPYYHCMARCVRRAFLCGEDPLTGQNFDHRKQWLIDHFKFLSSVFAIDICAYAVMSNHYHLVLYINNEKSQQWTELEIAQHWKQVFKAGNVLVDRYLQQQTTPEENSKAQEILVLWQQILQRVTYGIMPTNVRLYLLGKRKKTSINFFIYFKLMDVVLF